MSFLTQLATASACRRLQTAAVQVQSSPCSERKSVRDKKQKPFSVK